MIKSNYYITEVIKSNFIIFTKKEKKNLKLDYFYLFHNLKSESIPKNLVNEFSYLQRIHYIYPIV